MADPLGFISRSTPKLAAPQQSNAAPNNAAPANGPAFKDVLLKSLDEVNAAQVEATKAVEDLKTGQSTDVEGVILATQKADNAFRMLQSLRNRMMEAYDEVKQVRV
jgi:flagellar hook-basal body complex protein FliE